MALSFGSKITTPIKYMKKMLVIFGTRPEAIKLAPIVLELKKLPESYKAVVCSTGQHREMLNQVLDLFQIEPDYNFDLMTENQNLSDTTAKAMSHFQVLLSKERPDLVIIQGDTLTTYTAALSSYYQQVPVAHIEAGLRTYNNYHPYPEEAYRRMVTILADYHFAPTEQTKINLMGEGIPDNRIWVTGNTGIDAFQAIVRKQNNPPYHSILTRYFLDTWQLELTDDHSRYVLITGHRRENFTEGIKNICRAINELAPRYADTIFIYVTHNNPNVQEAIKKHLNTLKSCPNIKILPPLDYGKFVYLLTRTHLIMTDSGGIQEEAPNLGKPVLILRNVTERPEGIMSGNTKIIGTDTDNIVSETEKLLEDQTAYEAMSLASRPYGNGNAAKTITNVLIEVMSREPTHTFEKRKWI